MCELQYDKKTLFKVLQIVEDHKENIDEVTYIEICNMLKDMSTFPKLPPINIDGHYLRRVLPPTNLEMIMRFENHVKHIDKSITLLQEEKTLFEMQMRQIQLELNNVKPHRNNKRIRKKKLKVLDISRDVEDIKLYITKYALEKVRYKERIGVLSNLNPNNFFE